MDHSSRHTLRQYVLPSLLVLGSIGYYLFSVFSTHPFLQHEELGIAYFWSARDYSFLNLLFDQIKNDDAPGRFRYVHYLAEGIYWRALKTGLLPNYLYDFLALFCTMLVTGLLALYGRQKKLSKIEIAIALTFFLLSIPSFMIVVFHYRKAKYLSTLFLLILMLSQSSLGKSLAAKILFILSILLGILTDPFFIALAPVFVLAHDLSQEQKSFIGTKWMGLGYVLGFLSIVLLNGVIGPIFNESCRLILSHIPGKPTDLLALENLPASLDILSDIFLPLFFIEYSNIFSEIFLSLMLLGTLAMILKTKQHGYFVLAILITVPILAFFSRPDNYMARFATYYGHPLLLLVILAFFDTLLGLRKLKLYKARIALIGLFLGVIGMHQFTAGSVFKRWQSTYLNEPETFEKYVQDRNEIMKIRTYLSQPHEKPYELNIDYQKLGVIRFTIKYEQWEEDKKRERTNLAYVVLPILFYDEIQAQKIRIVPEVPPRYRL